jgi:hypothetical protein
MVEGIKKSIEVHSQIDFSFKIDKSGQQAQRLQNLSLPQYVVING